MAVSLSSNPVYGSLNFDGAEAVKFNAGGIVGGLPNAKAQGGFAVP